MPPPMSRTVPGSGVGAKSPASAGETTETSNTATINASEERFVIGSQLITRPTDFGTDPVQNRTRAGTDKF